jgi:hypothetical protein
MKTKLRLQWCESQNCFFSWNDFPYSFLTISLFEKKVSFHDFFMTTLEREKDIERKKGTTNSAPRLQSKSPEKNSFDQIFWSPMKMEYQNF